MKRNGPKLIILIQTLLFTYDRATISLDTAFKKRQYNGVLLTIDITRIKTQIKELQNFITNPKFNIGTVVSLR